MAIAGSLTKYIFSGVLNQGTGLISRPAQYSPAGLLFRIIAFPGLTL
jgi:hypothetical protein